MSGIFIHIFSERPIHIAQNPQLRHRTLLMLLYANGLRRAEAVHLKIGDIDTALMLIHVHQGKGSRDRDLPLTPKLLEALREYWRWCKNKPRTYLFPSRVEPIQPERPLSDKVVWNACHEAALRAGLTKRIGPHVATQFCDPHAGGRNGPAHNPDITWASTSERYGDLSACLSQTPASGHQSAGSDLDPRLSER